MSAGVKELWRHVRSYLPWRREDGSTEVAVGRTPTDDGSRAPVAMLDRIMDPFFDPWRELLPSPLASRWVTPVELDEDEEGYDVRVEVPGYRAQDLDVSVTSRALTVRAARSERHGATRSEGYLSLTVPLPDMIDRDAVEAETRDGILHVRLRKSAEARSRIRRIAVNG